MDVDTFRSLDPNVIAVRVLVNIVNSNKNILTYLAAVSSVILKLLQYKFFYFFIQGGSQSVFRKMYETAFF